MTFTSEQTYCAPTDATVIADRSCTVPISTLQAAPYNLPWGSHIYARVSATNDYGTSAISASGDGAIILTVPSPVTVANYASLTSASQVSITWTPAAENGGTAILFYQIQYSDGLENTVWTDFPIEIPVSTTQYTFYGKT